MNTNMLGVKQFIEFIFTRDRNETWIEVDLKCGKTDEMEMHCSANAEATGSNPVEARKIFFGQKFAIA